MATFRVLSAVEQVVEHLRQEICRGAWGGMMPGGERLSKELGIGRGSVERALRVLEHEGVLVGQGNRRQRLVELRGGLTPPSLRVGILRFEAADPRLDYMIETEHLLLEAGHVPFYAAKTLGDLGMDVRQVARFIEKNEADAWVVIAASREVLEWFAARRQPAFALFGRRQDVVIAGTGPHATPVMTAIVRRLRELGHHRIVLLSRRVRRLPHPAQFEQEFLAELDAHGLMVGPYNLPDWEESRQGLHHMLKSLFHLTPPTAIIVDEQPQFTAVLAFLAGRGIRVPDDVSLVCTDPDRTFDWCEPQIAHIGWDVSQVARSVSRWASKVARGKDDRLQTLITAAFVEGGSIGPVKKGRQ